MCLCIFFLLKKAHRCSDCDKFTTTSKTYVILFKAITIGSQLGMDTAGNKSTSRIESFGYIPVWFIGRRDLIPKPIGIDLDKRVGMPARHFCPNRPQKKSIRPSGARLSRSERRMRDMRPLKSQASQAWQSVTLFFNRPESFKQTLLKSFLIMLAHLPIEIK